MTNEETIDEMTQMHLHGMAVAMRELLRDGPAQELGPHEVIGMLIDREWQERDNRRLSRLLRLRKELPGRRAGPGGVPPWASVALRTCAAAAQRAGDRTG